MTEGRMDLAHLPDVVLEEGDPDIVFPHEREEFAVGVEGARGHTVKYAGQHVAPQVVGAGGPLPVLEHTVVYVAGNSLSHKRVRERLSKDVREPCPVHNLRQEVSIAKRGMFRWLGEVGVRRYAGVPFLDW